MPKIQIDMFEVQLGAAILLSFDTDGDMVRVLADGGVKASRYAADHVHAKLGPLFGTGPRRIDLMIGTHYDEDHLIGLVPIISDETIEIGEAWLPPVADDSGQFPVDLRISDSQLLVERFAGESGDAALEEYRSFKRREIETLLELEGIIAPEESAERFSAKVEQVPFDYDDNDPLYFFRRQLADMPDDGCDHAADAVTETNDAVEQLQSDLVQGRYPLFAWRNDDLKFFAKNVSSRVPAIATAQAQTLANLRRSTAKEAINATALHAVVQALGNRTTPVAVRTQIIDDGVPRTYRWDVTARRFILAKSAGAGLSFTLLGPSASLVRKHRDKLPVAETSKIAMAFRGEIRSITASNQLSYIGCFRFAEQSILIAGDAGCVDFALDRTSYHPALLAAMRPLHVIQVAHHGGNNAHFYRVLDAAGYPEQVAQSFLLLSHAYQDKTRPSDVFHDFLLSTLREGDDVKLLFTSEPKREKVVDFLGAIHSRVGEKGMVGDVQLRFDGGHWNVTRHAIEVV